MTKDWCLNIEKMQDGGFVVFEGRRSIGGGDPYTSCGPLFACTTIGEALEFIKGRLAPAEVESAHVSASAIMECPAPASASKGYPLAPPPPPRRL